MLKIFEGEWHKSVHVKIKSIIFYVSRHFCSVLAVYLDHIIVPLNRMFACCVASQTVMMIGPLCVQFTQLSPFTVYSD